MTPSPYYGGPLATLLCGDVLRTLAGLEAESVDCAVTSPPYWGLRRYSGDQGDEPYGLEPTPELYIEHTIAWLRAVRRVLKPTGSLFLNLGDSYSGGQRNSDKPQTIAGDNARGLPIESRPSRMMATDSVIKPLDLCGIPEQVVLAARADGWYWRSTIIWQKPNPMPESVSGWSWQKCRVKVGKQKIIADGRYKTEVAQGGAKRAGVNPDWLAQWSPCPGCVKCEANDGYVLRKGSGRPTSSFEYLYMLTKTSDYYFDTEAVREPQQQASIERAQRVWEGDTQRDYPHGPQNHINRYFNKTQEEAEALPGRNIRNVWTIATHPFSLELCTACKRIYEPKHYLRLAKADGRRVCSCGASDWLSHFATYPPDLVRPCILASTSERGNCPSCGQPWARVVERQDARHWIERRGKRQKWALGTNPGGRNDGGGSFDGFDGQTLGWRATCRCGHEPVPAVVLDPFVGSGTTSVVAKELGRQSIGIDLAEDYLRLAQYRIEHTAAPLPLELPPVTMGPKPELAPVKTKLPNVLDGQATLL